MSTIPSAATARLRKTFQYPTDDSSSANTPEILDEEEQENLIQTLSEQNEERNRQFRLVMLALPALSAIPYLLTIRLLSASALPSLLGLSSLASTAWLLYRQEPTETGMPLLDAWARGDGSSSGDGDGDGESAVYAGASSSSGSSSSARRRRRRRLSSFSLPGAPGSQRSPLETYLPLLNAGLCAVLLLTGVVIARREDADGSRLGRSVLACLPGIVYGVVVAAKLVMASVDPEKELSALRYEAKGA